MEFPVIMNSCMQMEVYYMHACNSPAAEINQLGLLIVIFFEVCIPLIGVGRRSDLGGATFFKQQKCDFLLLVS